MTSNSSSRKLERNMSETGSFKKVKRMTDVLAKMMEPEALEQLQEAADIDIDLPNCENTYYFFGFRILKSFAKNIDTGIKWAVFRWVMQKESSDGTKRKLVYTTGMIQMKADVKKEVMIEGLCKFMKVPKSALKLEAINDEDTYDLKMKYVAKFDEAQHATCLVYGNPPQVIVDRFPSHTSWVDCLKMMLPDP